MSASFLQFGQGLAKALVLALAVTLLVVSTSEVDSARRVSTATGPAGSKPVFMSRLPRDFAHVTVSIEPTSEAEAGMSVGDTLALAEVPEESVLVRGRTLRLLVAPEDVPAEYIDHNGGVTFTVDATDEKGELWTSGVSVQMVVDEGGQLAWVDALSPSALAAAARPGSVPHSRAKQVPPGHDVASDGAELPAMVSLGKPATEARPGVTPAEAAARDSLGESDLRLAGHGHTSTTKLLATKRVWTTVGTTYPLGASTARVEFRGWEGHSMGVATSVSSSYGSWEQTRLKKTTDEWGYVPLMSSAMRSYQLEMSYGRYKVWYDCFRHHTYCKVKYEWRPRWATGGHRPVTLSTRPGWKRKEYCTSWTGAGDWYRQASGYNAYSYSAGVKLKTEIGIDLGVSRQYSKEQGNSAKHHYFIRNGNPKIMCGDNHVPARSGKQVERYRSSVW